MNTSKLRKAKDERAAYHHGDLPDALKQAILDIIAEEGIANVSMIEAARRAGVSRAAPYRHFQNLDELLTAAACDMYVKLFERQMQRARAAEEPAEEIAAIVEEHFAFARENPAAFDLLFNSTLRMTHPELKAVTAERNVEIMRMVTGLGEASGTLREELVEGISAIVHGVEKKTWTEHTIDAASAGARAVALITLLIDGFHARRLRKSPG